jgi:UDP-N-acetylglucosamine 4,6-dehydratase
MITSSDSFSTYDMGKYYAILPQVTNWNLDDYVKAFKAEKVPEGFQFNSGKNTEWVNAEDIRKLIKQHLDPDFKV